MALVKYGAGIVQMSGSIAGQTHARNRFGNYIRARTTPVNPQSNRQTTVRARLAYLAQEWADSVSATQRLAWEAYADAVNWHNRLGDSVKLTGFNHFIRGNMIALQCGYTQVNNGPVVMALPPADPLFAVALSEANGITVTFDDAFEWCNEDNAGMSIDIGTPQNATRTFFNGPWRFHAAIDGDSVAAPTTPDGPTAVTAWTLIEGHQVWVRARIVRADTRASNVFTADSVLVGA